MPDVIVLGGGPAGVSAALRARELGASVALVERGRMGGACANDGCVPTRTLAKAARLARDAEQLRAFGLPGGPPRVDFAAVLGRAAEAVEQVHAGKDLLGHLGRAGVTVLAGAGAARFIDPHTIAVGAPARELRAERIVVCVGGHARRLPVPGAELALTHSDVWSLEALPGSAIVVGGSATGCQLASVLEAFGARVTVLDAAPRLLGGEDEDVAGAIAGAFRRRGIEVLTGAGAVERLERRDGGGLRLWFSGAEASTALEADAVIMAIGWPGNLDDLHLDAAGIRTGHGWIMVDDHLRTTAPGVYAAGDVCGRMMLVQSAQAEGRLAVEHALLGEDRAGPAAAGARLHGAVPHGGFTDPEYGGVGMTEAQARATEGGCAVAAVPYADLDRAVIDGRTEGFAKLLVSPVSHEILGAHVVGEQAVEVVQIAAAAMTARMPVERLAAVEFAYPTFTSILGLAARQLARQLGLLPLAPDWLTARHPRDAEWEHKAAEAGSSPGMGSPPGSAGS